MRIARRGRSSGVPGAIHFVGGDYRHIASRSGYARVMDHVGKETAVELIDGSNRLDLPSRLCRWMSRGSAHAWYTTQSFRMEVDAIQRLLRSPGSVFHVLNAEDTFRYLGHARSVSRLNGSKIVATYHQPPGVLDRVVGGPRAARNLDAVIVLGSNQVQYFAPIVGRDRVFLIPHGVDTDYFAPGPEGPSDQAVCLFVGNWLRDFDMLRDVVGRVESADPSVRFRLVVKNERAVAFAGMRNVQVIDSISDQELLREYQSADLLVVPYLDVVASNTVLEGLSCGLPVVTTDVGAMGDYVTSDCGHMVRRGDGAEMAEAILALIGDGQQRRKMGAHGRQVALKYDWRDVAAAHVDLYRNLAA